VPTGAAYAQTASANMAMMASGASGQTDLFDDDNAVLDDDFLNDGMLERCFGVDVSRLI
jgi:hypothetical protein